MEDILRFISEVGFPIAAALGAGYFVFLTLKFILDGVRSSVSSLTGMIKALDHRVDTMINDILRIDTLISNLIGLTADTDRIARASQEDTRKD